MNNVTEERKLQLHRGGRLKCLTDIHFLLDNHLHVARWIP